MSVDERLAPFIKANERFRNQKKRVPWQERVALIRKIFPSVVNLDWTAPGVLVDADHPGEATMVMAMMLRDVIRVDQVEPGTDGPRPLNFERSRQTWREVMQRDFATAPFEVVLRELVGSNSVRRIAERTGLSKDKVNRLQRGTEIPTVDDMRCIAEGYGRNPAIFLEYRNEFVLAAVMHQLEQNPEMATAVYSKIARLT